MPRVIKVISFYFLLPGLSGTGSLSTWLDGACPFSAPVWSSGDEEAVIVPKKYPYIPGSACALNQPPFTMLDSVRSLSTAGGRKGGGVVLLALCDRLIQALFQLTCRDYILPLHYNNHPPRISPMTCSLSERKNMTKTHA